MRKAIAPALCAALLALTAAAHAQQAGPARASVTLVTGQTAFRPGSPVAVKVRVENRTRAALKRAELGRLTFRLEKAGRAEGVCAPTECLLASFNVEDGGVVGPRAAFEVELDLADLHWRDAALDGGDVPGLKSMAWELRPGEYHLFVSLAPADEGDGGDARGRAGVASNTVFVIVE